MISKKSYGSEMPALLLSVLSTSPLTSSAMPQGKWHVGAMIGAGTARISTTMDSIDTSGYVSPDKYKFSFKNSGPVAGLMGGYGIQHGKYAYSINLGGYRDFYTARNQGYKKNILSSGGIDSKDDLKRTYTMELSANVGRFINESTQLYGKIGVLKSKFRRQFSDDLDDARKDMKGWGGTVGGGAKRDFDSISLGLEYAFHYYEKMGATVRYGTANEIKNHSTIRPRYHNIFLTISKTF